MSPWIPACNDIPIVKGVFKWRNSVILNRFIKTVYYEEKTDEKKTNISTSDDDTSLIRNSMWK